MNTCRASKPRCRANPRHSDRTGQSHQLQAHVPQAPGHCLTFDGAFWEALDAPDPRRVVDPASGQWHLDNDLPGVITRESLDRAVFVSTAEPTGVTVHFQRRAQPYPGCA